ncbi:hypothetical protein [Companilactobacillus musae]|uniref:hypothetical protein n=1 Tax=Companilactobacillus musae TaxID=1903258 RepID=UPI003420A2F0
MKKSIKYAGIAAATLLTVAPVAAPVLSTVSTAQAADAGNTPDSEYTTAKNKFTNQFTDKDADTTGDYSKLTLGQSNAVLASAFNTANANVIGSVLIPTDQKTYLTNNLDLKGVKAYMTATDATGYTYDGTTNHTAADLNKAIHADDSMLPVTFTVYMQDKDINGNGDSYVKAATFKLTKSDEGTELTSINAKFDTPLSVAKNSKTAVTQLTNSTNVTLVDQDGKSVTTNGTTIGNRFYRTYSDAMNAATDTTGDPMTDGLNGDIKDGEFKTAGTYYQVVNYTVGKDTPLESFLSAYKDDTSKYTIYVNGKKASAGYDYAYTPATAGTEASGDTPATAGTDATISFVRAIKVSDNESTWTTTDKAGVVTTKDGSAYYTLKDDEGNTITNRALAKNTDWATDKVRTDQDGNKQYRVATGEWIDANDVTFSEKGDNNNNAEGAYTDVQALNGKVTLDGPSSFIYMLYNDNGASVSNRALAGNSEWYTDKKATNAAGQTVYHVATGEWVQAGSGVNYVAY